METPPPVKARFFYTSPLAIDDPLSPVPPPTTSSASGARLPPRPFSDYDDACLDKAWHTLRKKILDHEKQQAQSSRPQSIISSADDDPPKTSSKIDSLSQSSVIKSPNLSYGSDTQKGRGSLAPGADTDKSNWEPSGEGIPEEQTREDASGIDALLQVEAEQPHITGTPFIRAPSRSKIVLVSSKPQEHMSRPKMAPLDSYMWDDGREEEEAKAIQDKLRAETAQGPSTKIPVGVSRLHQVAMPQLDLEPIYWAPVNDVVPLVRATWFYKESMLPVEVNVANMLELGYTELQAWTRTWQDELNSAIEAGAHGEERIFRKLWPEMLEDLPTSRPSTSKGEVTSMVQNLGGVQVPMTPEERRERQVKAACSILDETSGSDGYDNRASGTVTFGSNGQLRAYATSGVIYTNATEAYLLKPNLQPSSYYGRRPLASYIRKGRKLGIAVVRGFDQDAWNTLHPLPQATKTSAQAHAGVSTSEAGLSPEMRRKQDPELADAVAPKVTDLVLVIHGIGQKLSERMESFHFTHAMNGFRREVNVELGSEAVRQHLRADAGGIMVLPVNWRHTLSFEEGGYRSESDQPGDNHFSLKDIVPDTLPAVRGIISDVMLDIPYYLSHHQPKMLAAVVGEANRVYKLWCANNTDFDKNGRVHVIAHSLGSVMALDILSKQPTTIPAHLSDPSSVDLEKANLKHFLFPVSNLFFAGSPAGLFLLLKRTSIRPRIDLNKPDGDSESNTTSVCGRAGEYGCLAVENFYNIMNPYDPVTNRLNATVDVVHAALLKPAWLPKSIPGWFGSPESSWFSSKPPKASQNKHTTTSARPFSEAAGTQLASTILPRLPSNVELETHNFSREEIAEKKMYLLNDNGQIDYMLRYGGGPLEIQYLTMLGAHSSYWLLKDFVRAVVLECGRTPGRKGTLPAMRAVKGRGRQ